MQTASPKAHLVRLALLLVLCGVGFAAVQTFMVPSTWNSAEWYRAGSLEDLKEQPLMFGGNESCIACHKNDRENAHIRATKEIRSGMHISLSCESCHGPAGLHVRDGEKIAQARIEYSGLLCLSCHNNLISTPASFPKQILANEDIQARREAELLEAAHAKGNAKILRHKTRVHMHMDCVNCHKIFHNPETDS